MAGPDSDRADNDVEHADWQAISYIARGRLSVGLVRQEWRVLCNVSFQQEFRAEAQRSQRKKYKTIQLS
jgi:hypothetical protein